MYSILITGGTGLVGKHLSLLLQSKGYHVTILSRKHSKKTNVFYWNVNKNYIDSEAIINSDYIIHLAGAGIANKRWSKSRKKELIDSRVKTTNLLLRKVKELNPSLKGFIAASGIGYYGAITSSKIFTEKDKNGSDFLSLVCKLWEKASYQFNILNVRTVIFRTGIVFSKKGGALQKIKKPIKLGFGSPIGSGNQFMPWIHIEDLCNMYIEAIKNPNLKGIYNAVAPEHITNKFLTLEFAKILNKKIWISNIPEFAFKILLGEMAIILLKGSRVSSDKISKTGFKFKFSGLKSALLSLNK
ncbi:TIGR01777 family oxidoreductase [Lutibacter sp.]